MFERLDRSSTFNNWSLRYFQYICNGCNTLYSNYIGIMDTREVKEFVIEWHEKQQKKLKPPRIQKYMRDLIHDTHVEMGFGKFNKQCGACIPKAIARLYNHFKKPVPKLIKDKMVQHDVSNYHEGAGWYVFPNGDKVRGKKQAEEHLKKINS